MCKGIKDLFSEIYRNHLHHLHHFCMIPSSFAEKFSNIWNIRKDVLSLQQERVKHLIVKNYVYRNIIL